MTIFTLPNLKILMTSGLGADPCEASRIPLGNTRHHLTQQLHMIVFVNDDSAGHDQDFTRSLDLTLLKDAVLGGSGLVIK